MNFEKPENQNFEKMEKKNCWRYHAFTHVYQKPQSYDVQFLRYGVRQIVAVVLGHFLSFSPSHLTTQKIIFFKKNEKSISRCHHFKLAQQKT